ncbi:MAG: YdcF family protein, partial [archaeon]
MVDTIICLGHVFSRKETIEMMRLRTAKAVELYTQGRAKKIIFTGGFKTNKKISEARFMADITLKHGIPKKDIILEEKANDTIENAKYCKAILDKKGLKTAIVVSSPHHMVRVKYIFNKIMKDKSLEFEKSKSNLGFFESIKANKQERRM